MPRIDAPDKPKGLPSNRLAELRIASGKRRVEIAAHVERDPQTLWRWENGQAQIPDECKHLLAEFFGVSISWLMGWEPGEEEAA